MKFEAVYVIRLGCEHLHASCTVSLFTERVCVTVLRHRWRLLYDCRAVGVLLPPLLR